MNRRLLMMSLYLFGVIPMAATLSYTWAVVLQAAIGGALFGVHLTAWLERNKP